MKVITSTTDALQHIRDNMYCKLGVSDTHGVGVFAIKNIPEGIDPFPPYKESGFFVVPVGELDDIDSNVLRIFTDGFFSPEGFQLFELHDYSYHPSYVNHNELDKTNIVLGESESGFITAREIKEGEEIFSNYNQVANTLQEILRGENPF